MKLNAHKTCNEKLKRKITSYQAVYFNRIQINDLQNDILQKMEIILIAIGASFPE